jgi:prepilin peptidase CpaA
VTGTHALLFNGWLAIVVLFAAVYDLTTRRIPNWLTVSGVVVGFAAHSWLSGWNGVWTSAAGMGLALVVYVPLFAIRALGAGDVKLMAAVGAIAGPFPWFCIFVATCLVGGLLALIVVISKRRLTQTLLNTLQIAQALLKVRNPASQEPEMDFRDPRAVTLPHGVSIAVAACLAIALGQLHLI